MSRTTFYCNEYMLLDNWKYYNESNMLLKNLLRRTTLSPTECATIYFENMHNSESVNYDRSVLLRSFVTGRKNAAPLLNINQVVLYQKDLDYITDARKKYHINYTQVRVLFGIIFFCRLYGSATISLDTEFKMRRFGGCFEEQTEIKYYSGNNWDSGYNSVRGMYEISDVYGLLKRSLTDDIGCVYTYPNFILNKDDVIAYTFNVTLENNRLNLSPIVKELYDPKEYYCVTCGKQCKALRPNASRYCKECAKEKERSRLFIKNKLQNERLKLNRKEY